MRKVKSLGVIFITGLSSQAFAATGNAKDGPQFLLVLIGFLLFVAGILWGIDYLGKNGKMIVHQVKVFIKKKVTSLISGEKPPVDPSSREQSPLHLADC